jgi:hypothetical protein
MQDVEHNKFKKMEALYGLSILLALALVVMPSLFGFFIEEPDQRAGTLAEELTHFLADYHAERGSWPLESGNELDLTSLGSRPAVASNTGFDPLAGANGLAPLVEEVPLDPWGRPFRAYLLGGGRAVAVVSAGPDGILDTNIDRLWSRRDFPHAFDGDDTGSILTLVSDGGSE